MRQDEEHGVSILDQSHADLRFDFGLLTAKYNNALTITSYQKNSGADE